jgi:hypothetical protein
MIVTRDDITELMHQYAKFANVKVYAQVQCKSDTKVFDESRDEVEVAEIVSTDASSLNRAKHKIRTDGDGRDLAEETSPHTDNTIRPFRSLRTKLGLLATRSTMSETTKPKARKKFAFRIPMKMRPKKRQLASFVKSPQDKDGASSDNTSDDGNVATNKMLPKNSITDEQSNELSTNQTTPTTASPGTTAKGSVPNGLQPVLFLDENGKAV